MGYIGVMLGYIGIMENTMETTIMGLYRVKGIGFSFSALYPQDLFFFFFFFRSPLL